MLLCYITWSIEQTINIEMLDLKFTLYQSDYLSKVWDYNNAFIRLCQLCSVHNFQINNYCVIYNSTNNIWRINLNFGNKMQYKTLLKIPSIWFGMGASVREHRTLFHFGNFLANSFWQAGRSIQGWRRQKTRQSSSLTHQVTTVDNDKEPKY